MPRDDSNIVHLVGNRRGRVVDGERAGEVRIIVNTSLDLLSENGTLTRTQCEAVRYLAAMHEAAGLRQRTCCAYQPPVDATGDGFLMERLDATEMAAWKRYHRALGGLPVHCRSAVVALVADDVVPVAPSARRLLRDGLELVAEALGLLGRR